MLDWIFEGAANWVASVMTQIMDAISGLFLEALGTDMTAMEEYFPFAVSAYTVVQYMAWALLFLVVVWQLFRAFGGPLTEAENPLHLLAQGGIFPVQVRLPLGEEVEVVAVGAADALPRAAAKDRAPVVGGTFVLSLPDDIIFSVFPVGILQRPLKPGMFG